MLTTRHLLYHICPFNHNNVWKENVAALRQRLSLFNGGLHVAICTGDGLSPPEEVKDAFADARIEYMEVKNDPKLREVVSFLPLFERVSDLGEGHAFLWAHGKGVQTVFREPVRLWRDAQHVLYLDHWLEVADLLRDFPVAGAFKKVGRGWRAQQSLSNWHYSGSWCWYRAKDLFEQKDWRRIDSFEHGIEPYPSLHFDATQAGCLFLEDLVPRVNLYNLHYWHTIVSPLLARWKQEHPLRDSSAIRLDLGGGSKARAGFINVDQDQESNVICDLQAVCDGKARLPWKDGEVKEVYSSHCFEHLSNLKGLLWEICRVCAAGSPVEIRVPHWNQSMAMVDGHRHTWSETAVRQVCETCIPHWWAGSARRLKLLRVEKQPGEKHQLALKHFARFGINGQDIMDLFPDTCHEVRYCFEVVNND